MGKGSFVAVRKSFAGEAGRTFGFLDAEYGLSGPASTGRIIEGVVFTGPDVTYRIWLDLDDKAVIVRAEKEIDDVRLVADVADLAQALGLVSRNQVATSAHTLHGLKHTLESQAEVVRQLHPSLIAADSPALMRNAGAREWRIS